MKTYWMAFCNDGVELFGIERATRAEAVRDLKDGFRTDWDESPDGAAYNDYYIERYTEAEDTVICHGPEYYKMTRGPRGGVKAERTRAI